MAHALPPMMRAAVVPAAVAALVALVGLTALTASCGGDGPLPAITAEELVTVTDTSFVISFTTDLEADTVIEYGSTPDLGSRARLEERTRFHQLEVTGLSPGTRYYYRAASGRARGTVMDYSPGEVTTLTAPPGDLLFTFATLNDTHVGEGVAGLITGTDGTPLNEGFTWPDPANPYWRFMNRAVVDAINTSAAEFTVIKGDFTSAYTETQFLDAKAIFDGLTAPYYPLRGNHDRQGEQPADYYQQVFGRDPSWYAFTHQGHRFILLDSVDPATGEAAIAAAEWTWLEAEVAVLAGERVLVFLHHPVLGMQRLETADGNRLLDLLQGRGVVGIFSGHTHGAAIFHDPRLGDAPLVTTPTSKEYPGGYALYRVHTGGYMQTFRRLDCGECREWIDITRGEYFGAAPDLQLGKVAERNFVYLYP
ncbi:MAG: metallophosphoesterase family protein [Deltaproteobacteria bacterium]|nr:metallophosphoesterase family protein [Deltaproteobacteria bacterium]